MDTAAIVREIESRIAGLPVRNAPAMRAVRREFSKRLRAAAPADVLAIAEELIARGRVHRFMGDELIHERAGALAALDIATVERLGAGISSWDQVDSFACLLAGPAWREGLIADRDIGRWAASEDRWWRRAALVSTVALNVKARGGSGDPRRTLRICRLLVDHRDDMVWKALSWALRAAIPHDAEGVRRFVEANESRLAATVRREVREKLNTVAGETACRTFRN